MKYCPQCQQRYSNRQRFCRLDGSKLLVDAYRANRDFDTDPTLEMPGHLLPETREEPIELGKDALTHLEPFGEADCESELKVLGSSEYSKYYFEHTRFNREALAPKVFLIIGRRGAGKTALSQFFSFQQVMPNVTTIEVDEPAAFQQLMSKLAESAATTREVAVPRLVKIWEFVIWSTIFWQLQNSDPRIKAALMFVEGTENVSTFIRQVLKALVSNFLEGDNDLADELEDFISSERI
ncbi:MAG TPA: hypothetical protein VLE19_15145, partial [Pyrinomonadaceae bacterium]|nr:hypothetical protein [Pyrinomonadaceae bacterium]